MSGVWPAWTCLVSNDQRAVGSSRVLSVLMACSPVVMRPAGLGSTHSVTTAHVGPPPVSLGARHNGPALAGSRLGYSTWSSPGAPHRGWRVAGQQAGA